MRVKIAMLAFQCFSEIDLVKKMIYISELFCACFYVIRFCIYTLVISSHAHMYNNRVVNLIIWVVTVYSKPSVKKNNKLITDL